MIIAQPDTILRLFVGPRREEEYFAVPRDLVQRITRKECIPSKHFVDAVTNWTVSSAPLGSAMLQFPIRYIGCEDVLPEESGEVTEKFLLALEGLIHSTEPRDQQLPVFTYTQEIPSNTRKEWVVVQIFSFERQYVHAAVKTGNELIDYREDLSLSLDQSFRRKLSFFFGTEADTLLSIIFDPPLVKKYILEDLEASCKRNNLSTAIIPFIVAAIDNAIKEFRNNQ